MFCWRFDKGLEPVSGVVRDVKIIYGLAPVKSAVDYFFVLEDLAYFSCYARAVVVVDLLMVFLVSTQEPSFYVFFLST